jgi:long-subunit fatty acid transport protein
VKYEFKTALELTNSVEPGKGFIIGIGPDGPIEMFPDGEVTNADMPALLSIGVDWRIIEPLKLSAGYHVFFEKQTGWENAGQLDNNSTEIALGAEFNITKRFLLSAGWMNTNPGTNKDFNSDLSFNVTSNTFGFGGAYHFSKTISLNLGGYFVNYNNDEYNMTYELGGNLVPYTVNYVKSTWSVALGLDFHFGGNKE